MKSALTILFIFASSLICTSQIILTHNVGDNANEVNIYGCNDTGLRWARDFYLADFDITEEFHISSITHAWRIDDVNGIPYEYNFYEIDDNFPDTFDETKLIVSSGGHKGIYLGGITYEEEFFDPPLVIPNDVERILVEIKQTDQEVVFFAGTEDDENISWIKSDAGGCPPDNYEPAPSPDARFYIKVTGENVPLSVEDYAATELEIYPNPSSDYIYISSPQEITSVVIYDINGMMQITHSDQPISKIDINKLASGIYFVVVNDGQDSNVVKQILKR